MMQLRWRVINTCIRGELISTTGEVIKVVVKVSRQATDVNEGRLQVISGIGGQVRFQ